MYAEARPAAAAEQTAMRVPGTVSEQKK